MFFLLFLAMITCLINGFENKQSKKGIGAYKKPKGGKMKNRNSYILAADYAHRLCGHGKELFFLQCPEFRKRLDCRAIWIRWHSVQLLETPERQHCQRGRLGWHLLEGRFRPPCPHFGMVQPHPSGRRPFRGSWPPARRRAFKNQKRPLRRPLNAKENGFCRKPKAIKQVVLNRCVSYRINNGQAMAPMTLVFTTASFFALA